jgi:ribonucleotide monophosphatase NagD (HAD superfamily)
MLPRHTLCRLFSSSSRAPAGKRLDFGFALDIDGVLLRGKTPIPGAADALHLLHKHNVP